MSAPIPLRQDFDVSQLRSLARRTKDGPQARRLLALAAIYDGVPEIDVSAMSARHSRVQSSTTTRMRKRRPSMN
jgi:hypothetical protein